MNLYEIIASKHGIPEYMQDENYESDNYDAGANAMKAQYDELLKGLVVDEGMLFHFMGTVAHKLFEEGKLQKMTNAQFVTELAKALANSTEIIRKG